MFGIKNVHTMMGAVAARVGASGVFTAGMKAATPLINTSNRQFGTRSLSKINMLKVNFRPQVNVGPISRARYYSVISEECKAKTYDYKQIKNLVQNPSSDVMVVDVREPVEFQEGHIPGAVNIPFKSNPGALGLSEEEFEESFGFPKPDPSKELVFYCLAGIRSTAAEDLARTFGYKKRGNYVGSYDDWVANEIANEKPTKATDSKPSTNA